MAILSGGAIFLSLLVGWILFYRQKHRIQRGKQEAEKIAQKYDQLLEKQDGQVMPESKAINLFLEISLDNRFNLNRQAKEGMLRNSDRLLEDIRFKIAEARHRDIIRCLLKVKGDESVVFRKGQHEQA